MYQTKKLIVKQNNNNNQSNFWDFRFKIVEKTSSNFKNKYRKFLFNDKLHLDRQYHKINRTIQFFN